MKTLKTISGIVHELLGLLRQSEVNEIDGQNPNTNAANSTAANFKRTSMFDGSLDDMIDGTHVPLLFYLRQLQLTG
jgi:hypothetical protein